MDDTLLMLFCLVDDFCQLFMPEWNKQMLSSGLKKRNKPCRLSVSEIMTLFIHFHQMRFRDFKSYYHFYAKNQLANHFPGLLSYNRFIELLPSISVPLCVFLQTLTGEKTGIYFVDSTLLRVCHIENLFEKGLQLITRIKKNMKNKLMPLIDKILLRKRAIIESVNDQLKNISQIEHTRHRSVFNFMVNILAALIAYALQPKKPSLNISGKQLALITT